MADTLLTELKSLWEFDETSGTTLSDSVGANDLAVNQGVVGLTGLISKAVGAGVSPAVPTRIAVGDGDANLAIPAGGDFAYSCWFYYPSGLPDQYSHFAFMNLAKTEGVLPLIRNANHGIILKLDSTLRLTPTSNLKLTPNAWNHHVVSFEHGVEVKQYINGAHSDTAAWTSQTTTPSDGGLVVNNWYNGDRDFTGGKCDQLGYWHRQLTQDDVDLLYNGGAGLAFSGFGPSGGNRSRSRDRLR